MFGWIANVRRYGQHSFAEVLGQRSRILKRFRERAFDPSAGRLDYAA